MKLFSRLILPLVVLLITSDFAYSLNEDELNNIVVNWNKACNDKNLRVFENYYADKIIYYGKYIPKKTAISDKSKIFKKYKKFNQFIATSPKFKEYKNGIIKCEFVKSVQVNNKNRRSYPSYLLIKNIHGRNYIIGESDLLTDNKLNYVLELGEETDFIYKYWYVLVLLVLIVFVSAIYIFKILKKNIVDSINKDIIVITKGEERIVKNVMLTENQFKGYQFEQFIVGLFQNASFTLLEWRSDKISGDKAPMSNQYPDLEYMLKIRNSNIRFAVECKWRSNTYDGMVDWASEYQISNYYKFSEEFNMRVFVLIGIGGEPSMPKELYSIPLNRLKQSKINLFNYKEFKRYQVDKSFFLNLEKNKLN